MADNLLGMILQLADGSIKSCNESAARVLGYSVEEMIVLSPLTTPEQLTHREDVPFPANTHPAIAFKSSISVVTALKTGQACSNIEMGFYQPNGSLVWLLLDSQPMFTDGSGRPWGVATTFREITTEKNSQQTLTRKWLCGRDFQMLADAIPGIFYIYDAIAHRNICINSQTNDYLGYTPQAVAEFGSNFLTQVMHPEDLAKFLKHIKNLEQTTDEKICKFEYRMRHKNGSWRWFCSQDRVYSRTKKGLVEQILGIAWDITNRKRAEIALKESEERLKLATDASGIGMWFWNLVEDTLEWTDQCKAIFGVSSDAQLSYEKFVSLLHPQDRDRTQSAVDEALTNKTEYNIEYRTIWSDHSVHWISAKGKGFYNREGKAVRMMGTVEDITETKQVEAQLYRSEQQLRRVLDSLFSFVGLMTTDGILIEANRTALKSANLQPEDVLNRPFPQTYWWSYSAEIQAQLEDAIARAAKGELIRYDVIVRLSPETYILLDFSIVPLFDESKEVEYLVFSGLDITEQEASKNALKQREQELELITEAIPQQIWTAAKDGHIDYINQRWQNYTGLNLEQMHNQGWATIVHPDDLPITKKKWIQAISAETKFDLEVRLRSADNQYNWFLVKARPLRNKQGQIIKWYGTNTSIKQIKKLEAKLTQQTKDLIEANRVKDDFLAIVSHELRTPLNPILGWSQLLASGKLDAEKTAMGIKIIERNAKLQSQLIDDLLDVSRILRGKLNLNRAALDLESVVRAAMTTVQLTAEAKSIQIEAVYQPDVGQVWGDPGRLQQVVWNLVTNAVKFTSEGGRIFVKLKSTNTKAVITIKDTGQGIESEFLPHVFDRFRQAESGNNRNFGGLGLGLAIVRHLTELHGGTVTVFSQGLGQGATFSVELPLMNISTPEPVNIDSIEQSVQPDRFRGVEILVVDDEVDSLDILTLVLEEEGATVIPVKSAELALEALEQKTPDLIVSDIGMPNTDGYTLMSQIRQLPQGQNIPAVALTAYAGEIDLQQTFKAGFQKHIAKPINIPEIIAAITELLE